MRKASRHTERRGEEETKRRSKTGPTGREGFGWHAHAVLGAGMASKDRLVRRDGRNRLLDGCPNLLDGNSIRRDGNSSRLRSAGCRRDQIPAPGPKNRIRATFALHLRLFVSPPSVAPSLRRFVASSPEAIQ